jgi:hypothetical protein
LKNPQLANAVLLEQLGLDTADMAVLVESEHRELMTTLEESGVQLGDRVKIRLWMDRKRQALMSKPYDPRRPTLQIESTAGPSSTSDVSVSSKEHERYFQQFAKYEMGRSGGELRSDAEFHRRLQVVDAESKAAPEDKGVSSDAIAIILTGLTAVGGYILQARQAAAAERAQAAQARESERLQKATDVLHQQRQVQTQRAQEWLQLAHQTQIALSRLENLAGNDFNMDIYDTVLASSPPDPAFVKGKRLFQMALDSAFTGTPKTPEMLDMYANDENGAIVDDGVTVCSYDRWYGRNMEGIYAETTRAALTFVIKAPYERLFRESLLATMTAEPNAPLARRFRMFVEHRLMPAMTELADQLYESGSLLEWPSAEKMAQLFPHMAKMVSRESLMFLFRSYTQSWCVPTETPCHHPYI